MRTLLQDVRHGSRILRKSPGFTVVAVLSLTLGIGANTAIFSILDAVLLRSLPVENPNNLVQIAQNHGSDLTNPIWEQIRQHQFPFSGMLAFSPDRFDLAEGGESHFAEGLWVSGDFFRVLGVAAIRGRVFTADDDQRGGGRSGPVAVISYNFWKRAFQRDENTVGKTVRLNRHLFEIVGIAPPWFKGLDTDKNFDVAIPIGCEPILHPDQSALDDRGYWWLRILGRLSPGETMLQAEAKMKAIAPEISKATLPAHWPRDYQEDYLARTFLLRPVATGFSSTGMQYRTALLTLMAVVGLVLLIACANIANLLLARATARQREFSVRMAIGANRSRVVRQLMSESLLLSILGAVGGILLALWGSRFLVRMISSTGNPLAIDLSPNLRVLAFTSAIALLTAVIFGLAPALQGTRLELNQTLKENTSGWLRSATRFSLGKALVVGQVALSLLLLVGAALFLGTLKNLLAVDVGFSRHNVLLVTADVQQAAIPKSKRIRIYGEILDRLRSLPGVVSAASSFMTPISGTFWNKETAVEGFVPKSPADRLVYVNRVSPAYFKTLQTPILMGRDFDDSDSLNSPKVTIINQTIVRQYFGNANPIGKTISMEQPSAPGKLESYQIIGVVKDSKYRRVDEETLRTAYVASGQDLDPWPTVHFEVRSGVPVEVLMHSMRAAIADVNSAVSLEFRTLEAQVDESLMQSRVVALLSSVFGLLALLLAMIGLYGITAYGVARRTSEIGIRIALGARQGSMIWLILRDVLSLLFVGALLGLAGSLAAGRLVASLLFGVRPSDPLHLAGAVLILAVTTVIAAYLPARKAARIDPMAALRYE